jgi:HD-like signal output (HDOD) protein
MTIETLLHNPNALPSPPKLIEELIGSFDDPDVSVDAIAHKLATDPVLSAKLLRLANSAYYHVSRSIGTVDDAVRMLGFVTVRTLVISSGLVSGFKTVPGLDLKRFWRYSLNTAVAAKWIARQAGENTDLAFTIGMMHGIGQLVIHMGIPEQARQLGQSVDNYHPKRLEAELEAFGYDSSQVGAELAARWKFPDIFVDSIRDFPDPTRQSPRSGMSAVIHMAVWRAQMAECQASAAELAERFPEQIWRDLGLAPERMLTEMPALAELGAGLEEIIS